MVGQQPELDAQRPEGLVLGTEAGASTPLAFWTYVDPQRYLQLDDVVHVRSPLPDGQDVDFYGVVDELRAVQEGVRFASDVALASSGVLPAETAVSAHVSVTRVEPEIFVPPRPGEAVRRAHGAERDRALFFDAMTRRLPVGLSRGGEPIYANLDFLDGQRGAHVNISGVSGVADEDVIRDVPPLLAVRQRRARPRDGEHARARLQREGRGSAVPRQAERGAARGRPRPLRGAGAGGRALPLAAPLRAGGARRSADPADGLEDGRRHRLLLDAARVLRRALSALPLRRRRRRALAARLRGAARRVGAGDGREALAAPRCADGRDRRRAGHGLRRARRRDRAHDRPGRRRGLGWARRPRHGPRLHASAGGRKTARRAADPRPRLGGRGTGTASTRARPRSRSSTSTASTTARSASSSA